MHDYHLFLSTVDSQKFELVVAASSSFWSYVDDSHVLITASNLSMRHRQIYVHIDISQEVCASFGNASI